MDSVLVVTVGGSFRPVLVAVQEYEPDFVCFICSTDSAREVDGPGTPCALRRGSEVIGRYPSIVAQAGLAPDQYQIEIVHDPDDPQEAYETARRVIRDCHARFPGRTLYVAYTGGTKSMSAGALMAAFDDGHCMVVNIRGKRAELSVVQEGTETPEVTDVRALYARRRVEIALEAFTRYEYVAAEAVLREAVARDADRDLKALVRDLRQLARGLAAWDRADYDLAATLLNGLEGFLTPAHRQLLGKVRDKTRILRTVGSRWREPEMIRVSDVQYLTPEPVYDLILNARRRASQGRFDDAVGRLYRALELYAQIELLRRDEPVLTANVLPERLPESVRPWLEQQRHSDRIALGLVAAYDLLAQLAHPAGLVWAERRGAMLAALEARNHSLLAHGFVPVTAEVYASVQDSIESFIGAADAALGRAEGLVRAPQFPQTLPEETLAALR